jgi:hypothetical protein
MAFMEVQGYRVFGFSNRDMMLHIDIARHDRGSFLYPTLTLPLTLPTGDGKTRRRWLTRRYSRYRRRVWQLCRGEPAQLGFKTAVVERASCGICLTGVAFRRRHCCGSAEIFHDLHAKDYGLKVEQDRHGRRP